MAKLWLDDLRPAPEGYRHVYTVEEAIYEIMRYEQFGFIVLIVALYLDVLDPILNFFLNVIFKVLFLAAGGGLL